MTRDIIDYMFTLTYRIAKRNLEGISDEQALMTRNESSSLNWIAGHMLRTRSDLLEEIKAPRLHASDELLYYRPTEEEPIRQGEPMTLKEIFAQFEHVHQPFLDAVWTRYENASEDDRPQIKKYILFYSFHESYHVGQIPLLKRVIGITADAES